MKINKIKQQTQIKLDPDKLRFFEEKTRRAKAILDEIFKDGKEKKNW